MFFVTNTKQFGIDRSSVEFLPDWERVEGDLPPPCRSLWRWRCESGARGFECETGRGAGEARRLRPRGALSLGEGGFQGGGGPGGGTIIHRAPILGGIYNMYFCVVPVKILLKSVSAGKTVLPGLAKLCIQCIQIEGGCPRTLFHPCLSRRSRGTAAGGGVGC